MLHTKELSFSDRLLRYSATASLIASGTSLAVQPALAIAGITDVDPDIVMNANDPSTNIDFNGDSLPELTLNVNTFYTMHSETQQIQVPYFYTISSVVFTSWQWSTVWNYYRFYSAQIVGDNLASGVQLMGGAYPQALAAGVDVSASASGWATPAVGILTNYWRGVHTGYSANGSTSSYKGEWIIPVGTHYLGVKFTIGANTHYGWVELEAVDANESGGPQLTVKAYGYNPTPDAAIKTGFTPNAVDIAGAQASGGLQTVAASVFAALGGALTWLRRKLRR